MDTHKSRFVAALEHFWNGWASGRKDIMLIACGSATAWITNKLFKNKGGLFNRATRQIYLKPFTLAECQAYCDQASIRVNTHDLAMYYMIFGGVPYYLSLMDGRYSLPGNVDRLCFRERGKLTQEFDELFQSIFDDPEKYVRMVRTISQKKKGLTRDEILRNAKIANGGNVTRILGELEASGFVRSYAPFGKNKNGKLYQMSDPFLLFYLDHMGRNHGDAEYWGKFMGSPGYYAWAGYAFEQLCLAHVPQISRALGIGGVIVNSVAWRSNQIAGGTQIDLLLDRNDNVINICEMKYASDEYAISSKYETELRHKCSLFRDETHTRKAIHLTMVTTYGVKPDARAGIVHSQVTLRDIVG
ncbi:MAG: ATP-binding protein [Lachnospiraceae bacterium]|jgi:hypothetical protein|nr:ATP-binding protein [Lachnospiraceae bacterium]